MISEIYNIFNIKYGFRKMINTFKSDLEYIKQETSDCNFENSKILITGCGGFLGYYLTNFFAFYKEELKIDSIKG